MTNYQVMPPLDTADYDALKASIAAVGVQVPVIVDEHGTVIDGHHRKQIATELGIDYPTVVRTGLTDTDKRTIALSLNVARRHLTPGRRHALITDSLLADPQLSNRQHAERTGSSHPTVARVRAHMEADGRLERFTSRTGADGRERPAGQPERQTWAGINDAVGTALDETGLLILEAWSNHADTALGYSSWDAYVTAKLSTPGSELSRLMDLGRGLRDIRDNQLYADHGFADFDTYRTARWPFFTADTVTRLIVLTSVVDRTRTAA